MNWTYIEASEQINRLLTEYPKLNISKSDNSSIDLSGYVDVYRSAFNYTIQKEYQVEISVPIGDDSLPNIRETGNAISSDYAHRYPDGGLCLETDTAIRLRFIDGFDLISWMDEYVEPYFFSYEFYSRYGTFPFGERPHHLDGILHTYQEVLHTSDLLEAFKLLIFVAEKTYRGHTQCPCGSGLRTRNCHGKFLLPFMANTHKRSIAISDLNYIRKELEAIEQSNSNKRTTK